MSLDLPSGEMDVVMNPLPGGDDADAQQEKLSLTSSSSEDSSDENFGDSCCATMTGHSAETYHRYGFASSNLHTQIRYTIYY